MGDRALKALHASDFGPIWPIELPQRPDNRVSDNLCAARRTNRPLLCGLIPDRRDSLIVQP